MQALFEEPSQGRGAIRELLRSSDLLEKVTDHVALALGELVQAKAVSGKALNDKFRSESFEMSYGEVADFFTGLEGLIGPPNPNLKEGMVYEHCGATDSHRKFVTSNTDITTTSWTEWLFVVDPERYLSETGKQHWPDLILGGGHSSTVHHTRHYREPRSPHDFKAKIRSLNEQLNEELGSGELRLEEVCGARLYTGPMVRPPELRPTTTPHYCAPPPRAPVDHP